MRFPGFPILFLGLLGVSRAALDDKNNGVEKMSPSELCQYVFNTSCTLPDQPLNNEPGCICVPYYQCTKDNGTIITDGSQPQIIDLKFGEEPIIDRMLAECGRWDQFCCHMSHIDNKFSNTTLMSTKTPVRKGCGYRNPDGIRMRITDTDNEAQFAEFPWMVAVLQITINATVRDSKFECGGSLIHPRAVLTSAHNVRDFTTSPSNLTVRAGEWDTLSETEVIPHQERQVETIILHENFGHHNIHNDFAILILKTAFEIAPNVNTICLPQETSSFDAARCIATGWGKDKFGKGGRFQSILKRIELSVLTHDSCQTLLRSTRLGKYFELDRSFICAGGEENQDTCLGDGGGPLVCPLQNDQGRYVQAGIISWGIGCAEANVPGVYASVAYGRRWIDDKLALYNLSTDSYS